MCKHLHPKFKISFISFYYIIKLFIPEYLTRVNVTDIFLFFGESKHKSCILMNTFKIYRFIVLLS